MSSSPKFGHAAVAAAQVLAAKPNRHELTAEQHAALAAWPGWGPLAPIFEREQTATWARIGEQLEELLGAEALARGSEQVDNAFYTSEDVAGRIWSLLSDAGFTGGRVLDLGCGHGRFALACPDGLDIDYHGVEIDPTAAQIAQLANPRARIVGERLQDVTLPTGGFDLVVGNVPFGTGWIHSKHGAAPSLHGYFLQRAVEAVRPGGLVAIITSRFHLDSREGLAAIADRARFLGAVRLPSKAFAGEGTAVVADLLVLQIRQPFDEGGDRQQVAFGSAMIDTPVRAGDARVQPVRVSRFFVDNPELVAGQMRATGHFRNSLAVVTRKPSEMLDRAFAALGQRMPAWGESDGKPSWRDAEILVDAEGRPEGSFHLIDGLAHQVVDGALVPARGAKNAELQALVQLRDAVLELIETEAKRHSPDAVLDPLRSRALDLYRQYVASYGPLNRMSVVDGPVDPATGEPTRRARRPRMGGFRADPQAEVVFGIEQYDEATHTAHPAPILLQRTNREPEPIRRVDTAGEAVTVSLARHGRLVPSTVAALLSIDETEVDQALGDLAFRDPDGGALLPAEEYLSGNIAAKLDTARAAAQFDGSFARNVEALEEVLPPQLGPDEISVAFGAAWLAGGDIARFLEEEMGYRYARVSYTPAVAAWDVDTGYGGASAQAQTRYGTSRMTVAEIVTAGLNGGTPVVYDTVTDPETRRERRVRNASESALAADRLVELTQAFTVWLWSDPQRAERACERYNRLHNSVVPRRPNGDYLQFPSMAPGVTLWENQLRGIDHALRCEHQAAYLAHSVGAGKTRTLVGLCLKLREYGLANRPLITVPKPILAQFSREARATWPTAKFLVATEDQVAGRAKRKFVARAAAGDWDAVIVSHELFTSLAADPEVEMAYLAEEMAALQSGDEGGTRGAKALAARRRALENRMDALREARHDPDALTFADLAVDHICVDEAHLYKGLPVATRTSGLSNSTSQRALDLLIKITSLAAKYPGRSVATLSSGTPFVNSLSELFVWARICAPTLLDQAECRNFDTWAATFVQWETVIETSPDGGNLRAVTRPARIRNAPEARTMMRAFTDMLPSAELPLERPEVNRHLLVAKPSPAQIAHMRTLSERVEALRMQGFRNEPGGDNILKVCNDGRALALDPQLVGVNAPSPKLIVAADRIAEHYWANIDRRYPGSDATGTFQLVCLDLGSPHGPDGRTYGRLRDLLVDRGLPAERIRFIHEAATTQAREELFAACRDGSVSVLLGSSSKAGVGVNAQRRLSALYHVDMPWTAASLGQREGRAVRPGNLNPAVDIVTVVTEGTFDGLVSAAVRRKHQMIEQMFTNDPLDREILDISGDAVSLAEVSAAATGHPELIEQATLSAAVQKLKIARASHRAQLQAMLSQARHREDSAARADDAAQALQWVHTNLTHTQRTLTREQANEAAGSLRGRDSRRYRFGELSLQRTEYGKGRAVQVCRWGTVLAHLDLPRPVPRSASGFADALYRIVYDWSRGLPEQINRLNDSRDALRRDADQLRAVADSLTFDREQELTDAQAKLDRVTARIAVLAQDQANEQAAA